MCGRFVSGSSPGELAEYFQVPAPEVLLPENYNVAPTTDIYAVAEESLQTFHWGLVPMWAKDIKIGNRMINARAETVESKNAYRAAFKRRRCLIPATGFFEWKAKQQPMFIFGDNGEPLAMAGLYERWRGPDKDWEQALHSATIITTEANGFMSRFHDRMPVLLARADWDEWLDPTNDDVPSLKKLLVPAPEGLLAAHDVDPKVGKVSNRGPELIEPYSPSD